MLAYKILPNTYDKYKEKCIRPKLKLKNIAERNKEIHVKWRHISCLQIGRVTIIMLNGRDVNSSQFNLYSLSSLSNPIIFWWKLIDSVIEMEQPRS